jgi:hypothetical protein
MKLELNCPNAFYNARMQIVCKKSNDLCGNQRFKPCKGWSVLTDNAAKCPLKKERKKK